MSTRHEREHHTPHEETQGGADPLTETIASRRVLASALGAFGLAAFAGCTRQSEAEDSEDVGLLAEAVIGTASDVRYADSAAELRSVSGTGSPLAVLRGIAGAGDGRGGLFYWSTQSKPDDGWSALNSGSASAAGWRRVNPGFVRVPRESDGWSIGRALSADRLRWDLDHDHGVSSKRRSRICTPPLR
jgi:hypothetical protein